LLKQLSNKCNDFVVTGFLCFIDSQKSHTKHLMIIGKSTAQLQAKCPFKLILEYELFSWLKTPL